MIIPKQFLSKKNIQEKINGALTNTDILFSLLINRISQIAATEEQMRAEGKIDKEGHLVHPQNGKKPKNSTE
jgi:hypothetical protein